MPLSVCGFLENVKWSTLSVNPWILLIISGGIPSSRYCW